MNLVIIHCVILCVLFLSFKEFIVGFYTNDDKVAQYGVQIMVIYGFGSLFDGISNSLGFILRALDE